MRTFYSKDSKGILRLWSIEADYDTQELIMTHGTVDGKKQVKREFIESGKASRSLHDQIELQMESRIRKQMDKGYVEDYDTALEQTYKANQLQLPRPMLAMTIEDVPGIDNMIMYAQRKYDGNRCLIANIDDNVVAYSRNGKVLNIPHITNDITIPRGMIVDGELYCHGETLQTICSWIKRQQDNTKLLQYVMYDVVSELPFRERYDLLDKVRHGCATAAPTYTIENKQEAYNWFKLFRDEGYEGAMIRWGKDGYIPGKRSKNLLKMKAWNDTEFKIVDIASSKDGWGVLVCESFNGSLFKVSAPGTIADKMFVSDHKGRFIGKYVTVEFAYYTADGIPFNPVAKGFRSPA